jgi:WD40 repeat protein
LEAPDDIQCFQFSPTDPHVIAGGCINGQVVMWDIKEYEDRIRNPRADHRDKDLFIVRATYPIRLECRSVFLIQPGFEDESFFQTPHIRYSAVSNIEHGHSEPISDLQWIPDHFQVPQNQHFLRLDL